jgi:hypothetical protein
VKCQWDVARDLLAGGYTVTCHEEIEQLTLKGIGYYHTQKRTYVDMNHDNLNRNTNCVRRNALGIYQ